MHKCHVRKLGFDLFVDLHIEVSAKFSVADGHLIAHQVKDRIRLANPAISDVMVHVEPAPSSA
jgi:divalent metal cation (Fe/Co/Zn/Cd) transporter